MCVDSDPPAPTLRDPVISIQALKLLSFMSGCQFPYNAVYNDPVSFLTYTPYLMTDENFNGGVSEKDCLADIMVLSR